jgi:hypothetical protein
VRLPVKNLEAGSWVGGGELSRECRHGGDRLLDVLAGGALVREPCLFQGRRHPHDRNNTIRYLKPQTLSGGRSNGRPFLGTGGFYPHSFTAVDVEGSIAVCPSLTIDSS